MNKKVFFLAIFFLSFSLYSTADFPLFKKMNEEKTFETIIEAAFKGDYARVKKGIKRHLWGPFNYQLMNKQNKNGVTLLHATCVGGNEDLLIYLLEHGCRPSLEVADNQGMTPLLTAAAYGTTNSIRILLLEKANPNVANHRGQTPLLFAACRNDIKMAQMLLNAHADPHARSTQGTSVLDLACKNKNPAIAKLLLQEGAHPHSTIKKKLLALAAQEEDDILTYLLSKC